MATFNQLEVGNIISFETIAPSIINLKYTNVRFEGIVGWSIAKTMGDIFTLHNALYPSMDQATVKDDYRSYKYLLFIPTTGPNADIPQVLGLPWILEGSLEVAGQENLSLIFPSISPANREYLYQLLRANGFVNFQVGG